MGFVAEKIANHGIDTAHEPHPSPLFSPQSTQHPYLQWRIQDFPEEGTPTYDFAKFSQKLHEIERIWTRGGARVPRAPP